MVEEEARLVLMAMVLMGAMVVGAIKLPFSSISRPEDQHNNVYCNYTI